MKSCYLSVIIPLYNEEKNILMLYNEIFDVMKNDFQWYDYEVIIINDGSVDKTWEEMKKLRNIGKTNLVLINTQRNYWQSIALDIGFRYAKWDVIFTLDWDGQNDPKDMKNLFDELDSKWFDVVAGWRKERKDKLSVKIITKIWRFFRKIFINDYIHDSGCTLRVYRRKCIDELLLWWEMHRYIIPILEIKGFSIGEIIVNHRQRNWWKSKYSFMKSFKGFIDLLYVWFIAKYQSRPLHLFWWLGIFTFFLWFLGFIFSVYEKVFYNLSLNRNWFFLLWVFLIQTWLMIFIFWIVIDILVRLYYNNWSEKKYLIKEVIREEK